MLKSYQKWKMINKEKFKVPKSVQDTIPIDTVYKDGIFRLGKTFSKSYRFIDVNYKSTSNENKAKIFVNYGELLNSFDSSVSVKISVNNRKIDLNEFSKNILIDMQNDGLDQYREEYNSIILEKLAESNDIIQEKYIIITTYKNNINDARTFFNRMTNDLMNRFVKIGSKCIELNAYERLKILHDFYRGSEDTFMFDLNDCTKKGHSFKDSIIPRMSKYYNNYFTFENKYGRVLYLSNYGNFIEDDIVSVLCELNKNLIYSMDIFGVPKDEAVREVQNKLLSADTDRLNWDRKQYANNNFNGSTPFDIASQIKECNEIMEELVARDQKMLLCNITLVHLADSKEELDNDTEALKAAAGDRSCELSTLYFANRQIDGLVTCLPIGVNKLNMYRTLLTESASLFMPFRAQEIMDAGGIWYGQNQITNNPIICNKENLNNYNAFVLGVPGSGKSFISKEEIEFIILHTKDDVIVADPEGEYDLIIKAMHGQIINIGSNSNDHINAMDMTEGYGDSGNSIGEKSQFIMSIFEQLDKEHGISSIERSIIDRCVALTYKLAKKKKIVPTLKTLRSILLEQPEVEAKDLAVKLELFTEGSLNIFAHETNVDIHNRIISYNILSLGKQLKTVGLLVITDAILNRVNDNWRKGKRTHVFIDEIHVIFENEESITFFSSAWRQFRKRNAFPTGITQNVSYLLATQHGRDMLSNTEFIVMLNQAYNDREALAELLNISDEQLSYITNADVGSGLIKYGGSIVPFTNKIPKGLIHLLNSSKAEDKLEQQKIMEQLSNT